MPKLPPWLDPDEREEVMNEVGEYILTEVLDYVAQGISPVTGKPFDKLSKDYANYQKGGNTLPNLDLNGDMMRSVEFQVEADRIKIGIFDEDQAIKAYGHITGMKGHPWLEGKTPQRKLLPNEKETFYSDIMSGVSEIIDDYISTIRDQDSERELG